MNTLKKWAPLIVGVLLCAGLTAGVAMDQPERSTPTDHTVSYAGERWA